MKKTLLSLCLAAACGVAVAQNAAKEIAGTYTGSLTISIGQPIDEDALVLEGKTVSIEAVADDAVSFTLPDFSFEDMQLGDIFLPRIPVSKAADGSIRFGENAPENFDFLGGMITATAKINEASSSVKDRNAAIDVDVVWTNSEGLTGQANMPIYVRFTGSAAGDDDEAKKFDLNGDGGVDISDVTVLVEYILTH